MFYHITNFLQRQQQPAELEALQLRHRRLDLQPLCRAYLHRISFKYLIFLYALTKNGKYAVAVRFRGPWSAEVG